MQLSFAIQWIQILTHLLYKSGNSNPSTSGERFAFVVLKRERILLAQPEQQQE